MALIKINGDATSITGALKRLENLGRQPQNFLADIGQEMLTQTSRRIEQGVTPSGNPFAPLNPLYATEKTTGILIKSHALQNRLVTTLSGNTLIWGSNQVYAAVHQFGAIIKPKKASALKFKMGGMYFQKQSVTIPARPYLGFNEDDKAAVMDTLDVFFRTCLKG